MNIDLQRNAHAIFTNRNKHHVDLLISELTQYTHAVVCLQTTVNQTYILAPGHELTHSYTTDEKVHKRMRKSIFIGGLDMHMCQFLATKEATLSRGRMPLFLSDGTVTPQHLVIFLGGFR